MKKILALFMAIGMVVLAAPAMADFDTNDTFFVAYEEDESAVGGVSGINDQPGTESFFDMGTTSSFITSPIGTAIDTNITLGDFDTDSWGDVFVGLFGKTSLTGFEYYFSSDDPNYTFNALQLTGFDSAYNTLSQNLNDPSNQTIDKANTASYTSVMQATGNEPGTYGGAVSAGTLFGAEVNLAGISATEAIDFIIYGGDAFSDLIDTNNDFVGQLPTVFAATLTLDGDGSLLLTPVPVPAAVWLLGSGLLALVGIRRRKS